MNATLDLTVEKILENAKHFNYDTETVETADGGTAVIVYQSSFYRISYYFDSNGNFEDFEIEDVTKLF